jgi:uncharacterized membrane protein YkoI
VNSAVFKFRVDGSDYQNIQEKAKKELSGFIEIDLEELNKYVSYELEIEPNTKTTSTYSYTALVTARLKNV